MFTLLDLCSSKNCTMGKNVLWEKLYYSNNFNNSSNTYNSYIYIYIERERERDIEMYIYIYIYKTVQPISTAVPGA